MNNPNIDSLLEKYWQGESSLQEEQTLREFFQQENLSEHYQALRPLFVGVNDEATATPSADAEAKWLKTIESLEPAQSEGAKVIALPKRNWSRIAAVALILISVGYFWTNTIRNTQRQEALIAYNETKKALAMVGINFEKGKDKTAKNLKKASKSLEIIQPK